MGLSGEVHPMGSDGVYPVRYPDVVDPGEVSARRLFGNPKVLRSVDHRRPHSEVAPPQRLPNLAPDLGRCLHLISFEFGETIRLSLIHI